MQKRMEDRTESIIASLRQKHPDGAADVDRAWLQVEQDDAFQSKTLEVVSSIAESGPDSEHRMTFGYIQHADCKQAVVEVSERHGDKTDRRRFALSTLVHALLNLDADEHFDLEARGP